MSIEVISMQSGFAGGSTFTDNFNRGAGGIGTNWQLERWGSSGSTQAIFDSSVGVNGTNQLSLSNTTGVGQIYSGGIMPIQNPFQILNQTQYAQVKIISYTVNIAGGLLLFYSQQAGKCYFCQIASNGNIGIFRAIGNFTTTLLANNVAVQVPGDIIRLSLTPSAGNNVIDTRVNGVLVGSVTDSNALRCVAGMPGIGLSDATTANSIVFDDYESGAGV